MHRNALLTIGLALALNIQAHAGAITQARIHPQAASPGGSNLYATINGQEQKLTHNANLFKITENGRAIVWSAPDGAGGYENEGQSLWRYDSKTKSKRKIMAEYYMVDVLREVHSRGGRTLFLVSMSDGGLGAPHLAVVDPHRGEVWRLQMARLTGIRNARIAVAVYRAEDIGHSDGKLETLKPQKMLYLNLDQLARRKVIALPRSDP